MTVYNEFINRFVVIYQDCNTDSSERQGWLGGS